MGHRLPNFTLSADDHDAELNVVLDAPAAHSVLERFVRLGVTVTFVPIEVESVDRIGKEQILNSGDKYSIALQSNLSSTRIAQLCDSAKRSQNSSMLGRMACIHKSAGDVATLDMDAIVATYLSNRELFQFRSSFVHVDASSGITNLCVGQLRGCFNTEVATAFNASSWFDAVLRPSMVGA